MPETLRVSEYGYLPVGEDGVRVEELDYLCLLKENAGTEFFSEHRTSGKWQLRFCQHVGAISLPRGRVLEILPKISGHVGSDETRLDLMRLLAETGHLPVFEGELAEFSRTGNLTEAYFAFITRMAWNLTRSDLPKDYVRRSAITSFVKGRLDIAAHVSRQMLRPDRHEVRFADYTLNTPQNRLLKAAMGLCGRISRNPTTIREAKRLQQTLLHVDDIVPNSEACERLTFDRRTKHWAPLFRLITQLLRGLPSDTAAGFGAIGPAWLFDMNRLFEAYVVARLRRHTNLPVHSQGPGKHLLREHNGSSRFKQIPDIIVGPINAPLIIIDTKWKRIAEPVHQTVSAEDVRQIFAYGRVYGAKTVALAYPSNAGEPILREYASVDLGTNLSVLVISLPVSERNESFLDDGLQLALEFACKA